MRHIVRQKRNRGLASAFQAGLEAALAAGANLIVNTDADNQYYGPDVAVLVQPILDGRADIVVGDRGVADSEHFTVFKRALQRFGSWVVERAAGIPIPDATSGFRVFTREAALRLTVLSEYTYTLETLIQAGVRGMNVVFVPVRTNPQTRESRLMRNLPSFLALQAVTVLRFYTMYRPLRVFMTAGALLIAVALILGARFLFFTPGPWLRAHPVADPGRDLQHRRVPGGVDRADRGPGEPEPEDDGGDVVSGAAGTINQRLRDELILISAHESRLDRPSLSFSWRNRPLYDHARQGITCRWTQCASCFVQTSISKTVIPGTK